MESYITDISVFLPGQPVGNEEMESVLGMIGGTPSRARRIILKRNGIKQRHYAMDPATGRITMNNAQMTANAVKGLFNSDFTADKVDVLACGTSSPDQLMPGHANMVHGAIGGGRMEVSSHMGICVSGMNALNYARMTVASGVAKNAVATGSEHASRMMRAKGFKSERLDAENALQASPELAFEMDFLRWMLSDAAGAIRIQDRPNTEGVSMRIDWIDMTSFAAEMPTCMYAGAERAEDGSLIGWREFEGNEPNIMQLRQDVKLLNDNIVQYLVEKALPPIAKKRGITPRDVDWFLPHMSSMYFADKMAAALENIDFAIPSDRWFVNLETRGNTGSASMFVILHDLLKSGQLKKGQRILCMCPESGRFSVAYMMLTVV